MSRACGSSASAPTPPVWFDGDAGAALWDTAVDLDLRIVATLLTPELPRLDAMLGAASRACRWCSTTAASPICAAVRRSRAWQPLLALADHRRLHLKVTSHVLEDAAGRRRRRAFVERLAATFGAERLVWGSDYPQTHDRTYAELVALGRDACAGLPADGPARVPGRERAAALARARP